MYTFFYPFSIVSGLLLCVVFSTQKSNNHVELLTAGRAYCDAIYAFIEWKMKNQGVHIGLSDEGKRLLTHLIETYDRYARIDPFHRDDERRAYFMSLFDDFPPNSPSSMPVARHPEKGAFFYSLYSSPIQ